MAAAAAAAASVFLRGEGALGRREPAGVVPPEVDVERVGGREGPVAVGAVEGPLVRVLPPEVVSQQPHRPESAVAHAAPERRLAGVVPAVDPQVAQVGVLGAAVGARVVLSALGLGAAHVRLEVRLLEKGLAAFAAQKWPLATGTKLALTTGRIDRH